MRTLISRFRTGLVIAVSGLLATTAVDAEIPPDMQAALQAGDASALAAILEAGADPDARAETGLEATALMLAASNPDPALARMLIAAGAQVDTPDSAGDPAINWAAYYGHAAVVAELFRAGASGEQVGHGTVAEIAIRRGHQDVLALALDATAQDPQRPGPLRSAAHAALEAALLGNERELFLSLLALTEVNAVTDWAGRPILHTAARVGHEAGLDVLIEAGAEIDAVDAIGFTALFEAAREGHGAAVGRLLRAGADPDHVAGENGMALTATHVAAIAGHVDIIAALAAAGANPDVQDVAGATPLYWAAFEGQREAVLALLDAGADSDIRPDGTPDFHAVAEMLDWPDVAARLGPRAAD
ncbi:ankyrin repeat domain-containing protein [uncultured Maricaulis sp.]|uniref:ankyrin repeat domain-containing protein n=1 Tax=uncultured Maricaulis sp. TaxID=174710 RepID=UPI00262671D2|nr:ankyrin repeat domain-containing protein [uncultured Maricaulis sp.]